MFKPLLWITWYFHGSKRIPQRLVLETAGLASVDGPCGIHCPHYNSNDDFHYSLAMAQQDALPSEVMKRSMLASSLPCGSGALQNERTTCRKHKRQKAELRMTTWPLLFNSEG